MFRKTNKSTTVAVVLMASASALKFRPPEGSVPWHEAATLPIWTDANINDDHKVDYFVPNFGADSETKGERANLEIAEE
jgi:hypothetical protein